MELTDQTRDGERFLQALPITPAPAGLWEDIAAELHGSRRHRSLLARPIRSAWLVAASVLLAVVAGAWAGILRAYAAPSSWGVQSVSGTPTVASTRVTGAGRLATGEWLVTDGTSRARLDVGRLGTAEIGPGSRVRLERGGLMEHRLTIERGSIRALISAPPRLFVVRTPSVVATDLGCAYTLEVDSLGATRVRVTVGWVELRDGDVVTVVPTGLAAEVRADGKPGTPYPAGLADDARSALHRLDTGSATPADLHTVLDALSTPADHPTFRRRSAVTLWHLLPRLDGDARAQVYDRLARLSPPPDGVTREGIIALRRPMVERWRKDILPTWADEGGWWARLGRRLVAWVIR